MDGGTNAWLSPVTLQEPGLSCTHRNQASYPSSTSPAHQPQLCPSFCFASHRSSGVK